MITKITQWEFWGQSYRDKELQEVPRTVRTREVTKRGECSLVGVLEPTTAIASAPQRAFIASCCPRGGRGKGEKRDQDSSGARCWESEKSSEGVWSWPWRHWDCVGRRDRKGFLLQSWTRSLDPATLNKTGVLPQESYSHLGKKRRHIMT